MKLPALSDILGIGGTLMLFTGLWMAWHPLAPIVIGALGIAGALYVGRTES